MTDYDVFAAYDFPNASIAGVMAVEVTGSALVRLRGMLRVVLPYGDGSKAVEGTLTIDAPNLKIFVPARCICKGYNAEFRAESKISRMSGRVIGGVRYATASITVSIICGCDLCVGAVITVHDFPLSKMTEVG